MKKYARCKLFKKLIRKIENGDVKWDNYHELEYELEEKFDLKHYLYCMKTQEERNNYLFLKYVYSFFEKRIHEEYNRVSSKRLFIDSEALMETGLFICLPKKGEPFICSFENSIEKSTRCNRLMSIDEQVELLEYVSKILKEDE